MAEEVTEAPAPTEAEPVKAAAPDTPPEAPEVEKPAPKTYSQEEFDRIVAKVRKNERYRTKREIEAYYQGRDSASKSPIAPAKPAEEEKAPSREQFDSYEAFIDAKAEYVGRKAAREERAKAEKEATERTEAQKAERTAQAFHEKVREKFPDLEERAEDVAHIQMPPGMGQAIAESDLGPEILNHLVSDPKELERISALSPSAAIREIGKLEARLEAKDPKPAPEKPPVVKKVSAAPEPIKPGGGPASPGDDKPSDKDSIDDWMRKENARMRKRYG